jgi:hypothetical protein
MAEDDDIQTLESGDIYMFARPRVHGAEEEEEPEKLQNLYLVLSPEQKKIFRLAIIGRERLPDPEKGGKEQYWGFIEAVEHGPRKLMEGLKEETYQTKTRGERVRPAARPVGEGVYQILRHEDHTHLVYALELPKTPKEAQENLQIAEEASYVVSIKNPDTPTPPQAGIPEEAQPDYPKELQARFDGRKFGDLDPPDFLDYEGTQLLLISASADVKKELGIDLDPEKESRSSADIFRDLRLRKSQHPVAPLFEGKWA